MEVGADKTHPSSSDIRVQPGSKSKVSVLGGNGQGWDLLSSPRFLVVFARTAGVHGVGVKRALKKEK